MEIVEQKAFFEATPLDLCSLRPGMFFFMGGYGHEYEGEKIFAPERSGGAKRGCGHIFISPHGFATLAPLWKTTFMRTEAETSTQRLSLPAGREVRGGNMRSSANLPGRPCSPEPEEKPQRNGRL